MDQSREHPTRSRAALLGLLYCLSRATTTSGASLPLQHRVKSSQRQVPYQHTKDNRPKSSVVHHPFSRSESTDSHVEFTLEQPNSSNNHWVYYYRQQDTVRRPADSTLDQQQPEQSKGFFRRLIFDPFVGEESKNSNNKDETINQQQQQQDSNQTTNITSQVDVNSTYFNETGESSVFTTITNETTSNNNTNNSTEEEEIFQPLRIRAILAEDSDFLNVPEREALFHTMLSPALLAWSSALRVDPVVGNLTVDATQLSQPGNMCGPGDSLPSIAVPWSHLEEGIPDTDVIVYLSLGFTSPRNKTIVTTTSNNNNNTTAGTNSSTNNETTTPTQDPTEPPERRLSGESLQADSLMGDWVSNTTTSSFACNGDYLAAASYCSTDQYDRPTAALLHICVDEDFFLPFKKNRNARTIMHELGHALGFNSLSMAHFRRPDGTPITPRLNNGDIADTKIECTGPGTNRTFANVALPSEQILRFRQVRGGVRVAQVVTPSVLQVVRNHFGCQELQGAELESGEGLPLEMLSEGYGCIGDHWERRLYSTDLMNPVVDEYDLSPRISTLTLAYFADSGWYQVDLNYARVAAGWGRGSGCSFVNDTCIGEDGQIPPKNAPFFCNEIPSQQRRSSNKEAARDIHGCTPDLSRKATCSIGQYEHELPLQFQYFNDTYGANVGGSDPFLDYCPVYSGYANGLCSDISNERIMKSSSLETFGTRNSRCLIGDIGDGRNNKLALCLPIACVVEDQSLRIQIEGKWHECREEGQVIQSGLTTVFCPNPQRICPTFYCPFDCLGTGGVCDYESGECLCEYPSGNSNNDNDNDDNESQKDNSNETSTTTTTITTILAECGTVNETIVEDDNHRPAMHFPIIRPGITIDPPLDSPYIDYYVPDKQALEPERPKVRWALFVSLGIGGGAFLLAGLLLLTYKKGSDDDGDGGVVSSSLSSSSPPSSSINRNKDKMVATVLVDLRMRGRQGNGNDESLADTDEQLTESVASGIPSDALSDVSRYSEVDMDRSSELIPPTPPRRGHYNNNNNEEQHQQHQQEQENAQAIRRRKIAYA